MRQSNYRWQGLGRWGMAVALWTLWAAGTTAVAASSTRPAVTSSATASAGIAEFLPQGRVSGVEAVQLRFSAPAAAFGDTSAAPPVVLACEGPAPAGQGRWLDDTRWTYVFKKTLPAGVRCEAKPNPDFRDLNGQALPTDLSYAFDTGAPSFVDVRPYQGIAIDEEQVFILRFDAPVDPQAVADQSHCVVQGVGERIPVAPVPDAHRVSLMEAAYLPQPDDPATVVLLRCARLLPPQGQLRLEIGPGLRALGQAEGLPGSQQAQSLEYEVRPAFTARMSCSRERAGRPCLPVTPISLAFSAPVSKNALKELRLSAGDTIFQPEPDTDEADEFISYLNYPGPFPAGATLTLSLPSGLRDDAGRPLENASRFPLEIQMAEYPPLAKFASGTFGVIERFAHGRPGQVSGEPPAVPVTLRHVESDLNTRSLDWSAGQVASLRSVDDLEVLRWYARLQRMDGGSWSAAQFKDIMADREPRGDRGADALRIDVRSVSMLKDQPRAVRLSLPAAPPDEPRPFEVVGIPLQNPGFHLLEIESPRLGDSLLENGQPMYVRTGVLLTNLSLHLKQGQDDLLVWVTTLSDAEPVADAEITVLDCRGRKLASGRSDAQGIWHHLAAVEAPRYCSDTGLDGLFVSARIPADHSQAYGGADYAFVMSGWDRGIETWRFNVPTGGGDEPERLAHTVFDRSLLRAGETVSMKHYLRVATRDGLAVPADARPDRLIIEHEGSSQRHEQPVEWQETASGGLAALSEFEIPSSAKLGAYSVRLTDSDQAWYGSARFRVEEFRLPILAGQLSVRGEDRPGTLVAPTQMALDVQLAWLSGGAAAGQRISLSAVAQDRWVRPGGYDEYSFAPPSHWPLVQTGDEPVTEGDDDETGPRRQLFLDGRNVTLGADGTTTVDIDTVPAVERPMDFLFEASFADPNGEIQTLSQSVEVWPAAVQAGLKAESWERAGQDIAVQLVSLGTDARPRAGVTMALQAVERKTYTVRKRMVGGFYRYDSHTERKPMGTLCEGVTNADGALVCTARFEQAGSYELVAVAHDEQGRASQAYTSLWVSGEGEMWFGGEDDDRIDLIPAKREWAAGEEAEFQVRMPFREALALVSVEREGVLWTQQVKLAGKNPVIRIPVSAAWGPNAYVSVLVLRGRLYDIPWQSFFDWGWRRPSAWLLAWSDNPGDSLITSRIDLAKPAFRLGLAELRVSGDADRLQVEVTPDDEVLQVREKTRARVKVMLPDGRPAAHATLAFAVVDEALLELSPNDSWLIYEAMHPRRSLSVTTATSQMEVVGRRHYGRKAVAAGGGGGSLPTRQLFDTLISWQPMVQLDAKGEARVDFVMNDSLSRFRLVAVADHGAGLFGTAFASVVSRQDLQLVSGLPPVVREGDAYQATVTLRNGTEQARDINVTAVIGANGHEENLPPRSVRLEGGAAATVSWKIDVPKLAWPAERADINWRFEAGDGQIADRVAVTQRVEPRLPTTTLQASLLGLAAGQTVERPVSAPAAALRGRGGATFGGIALDASSSLVGSLEGVRDWWRAYPYTCLEQSASQAIALNDAERWRKVVARLITHMDDDGLLRYFPGTGPGSEVLTAYLVSASDDAQRLGLDFGLPQEALRRMLDGLQAFAQGQLKRETRGAGASLDSRRVMAMEALARHGRADRDMLVSLAGTPAQWPTPTVVDWLSLLTHLSDDPARNRDMALARNILAGRMTMSGTAMVFSDTALNAAPGLMATRTSSQARLILAVADAPEWRDDMPRIVQGLVGLQRGGSWSITTENLLGVLAFARYAQHFEATPATGVLRAKLDGGDAALALSGEETASVRLDWPQGDEAVLQLRHEGSGRAWVGMRAQARVPMVEPHEAGYRVERRVVPVRQSAPPVWSRGDVYRVELVIHSRDSANWVVLNDPVPAGATILGSGLGRDATAPGSRDDGLYSPAFVERTASTYRAYFDYLPAGQVRVSYSVRLNAVGRFALPPTRVEALYNPDLFGMYPNSGLSVEGGGFEEAGKP